MADTLTPEEKKRLTEELTKYATEGASDDDLRQFRDAFISELKKKGGGQPDSGAPAAQPTKPSAPSFGQKVINEALVSGEPVMKGVKKQPTEKKPYQDITYRREEMPSETTQMPETPIIKAAKKDFKQTVVKPQVKLSSTPEQLEEIEKKTETFDKDNLTLNNYQSSADIINDLERLYDEDVNVVYNRIQRRPDLYQKYSGRGVNEMPSTDPASEQAWQERNKDRDVVYQNYLADLESQRNKHSVATKQANDLSDSILMKKITPETYKNYTSEKTETTSFGKISAGTVVDMDKVDEEASAIAEKYNLPTDGEAWRLLKNKIKNQVAFEIRKPAALEKLKTNEPELYKKRQELFESGFTFDDSTYARVESQLTGLQAQYEQDAKNEFNAIDAEYKSKAEALNSQYAQLNAATEAKQGELTKLYQSGQIDRLAYESAWGQIEDEKKLNHENYTKEFPSPEEYVRKSNEINSKYNRKFDLQKKSLADKADAEVKAAYQKYASEYKEDPELLRQMNEAYSKAFEDAEKEALDKMGEAADLSVIPLNRFYQSTLSSLGGVFKGWGGSLDSKAFEVLGESMEQNFMMPAAKTEGFKDWLNPQNLQLLSGQLAGSMIPSIAVTATATALTGGMGIVPLVAGGLAGWGSETVDIVGRSYLDAFDRTNGNVVEANKAAERSLQSQYDLMWTYSLDALPFLKGSWLTKIPRTGARMAAGGAIELGTEFIQEYPQNIAEENISRGQDPWTNLGQALQDTDKMKQTLISIGPVAALGAVGQVGSNSRKQQAIDRYVALQQKSELSSALPDQRRQYIQSMVFDRGSKFASGVVGALYANGNIDQDMAADMLMQVAKADKIRESGKEAGLKGDKLNIYGFYTARAEEAERNAAKFGNDPILSESYKQMAKQYRDAGLDFMKGGKPDLLTITYADKSQEFLMPEDANALFANPAALASLNKKKISIEAYNDKGESIKVLDELKSRAETYASEKRYVAPVTRTSPLQDQRDAIQQRIQELDKQGPEMTAKERAKAIKDIEDQAAQEEKTSDQRDLEIEELQAKREALGVSEVDAFFSDMKPLVGTTVQRLEQGQNAPQSAIKVASDYLYAKYKELTAMKADPNRMMTIAQIESIQAQIEQDLQTLEGNPPSQQTQENDQENVQGVSGEVGVGQEPVTTQPVEGPSEEAPATGGVLQEQEEVTPPTEEQILDDIKNKRFATFTYNSEAEVPDGLKNKISSKGEINGKPFVKVTLAQSEADYELAKAAKSEGKAAPQTQEEVTTETAPQEEPTPTRKPSFRERVSMMFDPQSQKAVDDLVRFHKAAGIDVRVIDDVEAQKLGQERNMEGSLQGLFIADKDSGVIYLNRDALKRAGKTLVYHEGIHPVINILRNTNPELYKRVIDGLRAEAKRNPAIARAIRQVEAVKEYQNRGPETIEDETIVEVLARIAAGDIDINKVDKSLRDYLVDMWNKIAKTLGLPQVKANPTSQEFRDFAKKLSTALTQGGTISDVVGAENVKEFAPPPSLEITEKENITNYEENIPIPGVIRAGQPSVEIDRSTDTPIDVYQEKGVKKLPVKTLKEVYDKYNKKVVVINSDPTRVGSLTLPSGKTIFMYGGPGYLSVQDNTKGNVGFATTQESKVKSWKKYVDELFGNNPGVTLVATQAPTAILSNSYALRYVLDAISQLPKSVLKSSTFKNEFFGKDVALLKSSFGEKKYKEFISKYKNADLSNPEIIDNMISEMSYTIGNDNAPASFKARGAFVANLLGGLGEKSESKTIEGDKGYYSKKPQKYIASQLMDRLGINAEKVMRDIGEPGLVDLYINEGKWGFAVSGFETDPNIDIQSVQNLGVDHPLFNAKFPGKNAFLLDGAYEIDEMFKPIEMTGPKGAPYTKRASLMLAGSMYVKGGEKQGEQTFEYRETLPSGIGVLPAVKKRPVSKGQASVDIDRSKPAEKPKKKKLFSIEKARELLSKAEYTSLTSALELLAEYPAYLDKVANVILTQRQKLLDGKMPVRDVAKAYILTQGSIGSDFRYKDVLEKDLKAAGLTWNSGSDSISLFEENGKIRPEELTAWWLGTPNGKLALNDLEKGIVNEAAFNELETIRRSYGKNNFRLNSVFGNRKDTGFQYGEKPAKKNQFNLANIAELTQAINETKGDNEKLQNLLTRVNGISEGKKGFIGHMLGIGNMPTVDAVELNFWFTGKGEANIKDLDQIKAQTITAIRENISALNEDVYREISGRIKELSEQISQKYPNVKIPEEAMQHVLHHWIWDKARASATTHTGMYQALGQYSADIERTNDETRVLMEDAGDAMEQAVAAGTDPQEAVDDIVGNKEWYNELSQDQKQQFDEILQEYFGVTPNAPAQKATGIKATIANIIDNYYKGDRQSKLDNKQILESDPKLEYIYLNIAKINKQLQEAGVITAKTDGCP
jgi:hypothetical protein